MPPAVNHLSRKTRWWFTLGLFFSGLLIRLFRLNYWSPLPDEINYALSAKYLLTHHTLIGNDIMFFPPLFVYSAALLQWLGVELLLSVRSISAIAGAAIAPLVYLITSRYCPPRSSLFTATALLLLSAPNLYSRLGQVEMLMLFFIFLTLFFLSRDQPLLAGIALGLGTWTKETTLGTILSVTVFLLFLPDRWRQIRSLFFGLAGPLSLLSLLGIFTGKNLLFEILPGRGYDINMLKTALVPNLFITAANLGINLFPRPFTPGELAVFIIGAPLSIIFFFYLLVKGSKRRHPLSLFTACYLTVHLPFFFFFSRKFDYYLLPAALLLFISAVACFTTSPLPKPLRLTGTAIISLILLFNIYSQKFLYFNRGTHRMFSKIIHQIPDDTGVATSHPTLVAYLAQQQNKNLKIQPLFQSNSYSLNWPALTDTATRVVLLKKYYYDKLKREYPAEWEQLARLFKQKQELIDTTWSLWLSCEHHSRVKTVPGLKQMSEFIKPVGIVLFLR